MEGEEPRLPGLDMDHKQLFFLNFAQVSKSNVSFRRKKKSVTSADRGQTVISQSGIQRQSSVGAIFLWWVFGAEK